MYYRTLSRSLFLGARGSVKTGSDGTPFYLRPFVMMRGVQALQYQGEEAAEAEAELRWQLHPRFSLVGFGGAGGARGGAAGRDPEKSVTSGGAGFRYLVARTYGLHMGMDVGFGPDEAVLYVVFGSAWGDRDGRSPGNAVEHSGQARSVSTQLADPGCGHTPAGTTCLPTGVVLQFRKNPPPWQPRVRADFSGSRKPDPLRVRGRAGGSLIAKGSSSNSPSAARDAASLPFLPPPPAHHQPLIPFQEKPHEPPRRGQ